MEQQKITSTDEFDNYMNEDERTRAQFASNANILLTPLRLSEDSRIQLESVGRAARRSIHMR